MLLSIPISIIAPVRRLHDIGHSRLWVFLSLIPFVGLFFFFYLLSAPSAGPSWSPQGSLCINCGQQLGVGDKFCNACGAPTQT